MAGAAQVLSSLSLGAAVAIGRCGDDGAVVGGPVGFDEFVTDGASMLQDLPERLRLIDRSDFSKKKFPHY